MTTGRINQVTIFAAVALAGSGLPRGGVELVKGRGKTPGLNLQFEPNRDRGLQTIRLPQLNSPKRGPLKRRWVFQRTLTYPLQKEATHRQSHPEGRILVHRRTPKCVEELIAIGQQSTDSFGAERLAINRAGFGCPAGLTGGSQLQQPAARILRDIHQMPPPSRQR